MHKFVIGALVLCAFSALAQEQPKAKAAPVIGVTIASSDGRVMNWAPELRTQAVAVVERVAKNARVVALGSKDANAARKGGADYLIIIEISPRPYVSVGFGRPGYEDPEIAGHPRANAQGTIVLAWTVEALNGKELKLHDSRTVQASEYPLDPQADWLHVIASRSVQDAAAAAAKKLKSKAGI